MRFKGTIGFGATAMAVLLSMSVAARADAPVTDCDNLAAHPADPNKVTAGVQWDLMKGREAIRACEAAVQSYPDSLRLRFQLGRSLLRMQRRDDALPHLIDAAEKGYLIAYSNIGGTYQFDLKNYAEALKWYRRGAEQGDDASIYHLAELYIDGTGVPQNFSEAMKLYVPLAQKNNALAVYKIGLMYTRGDHTVPRDYAKAMQWYQRAAELGFARAQNDIGYLLEEGLGTKKDVAAAAKWYRVSAEQGWSKGQVNLARLHEDGQGVAQDRKEAFYWYRLAKDSRETDDRNRANARIDELRKRLSPQELAEVDARANKWRQLAPEETIAMLPPPADPNYRPPVELAMVDKSYTPAPAAKPAPAKPATKTAAAPSAPAGVDAGYVPPPAPGSKDAGAKAAPGGVDAGYVPPSVIEIESMEAKYVATKSANVRGGPDAAAALVGKLDRGQQVDVTGKVKGQNWLAVTVDGKKGYVSAGLVEPAKPTAVAAAPAAPPAAAPAPVATPAAAAAAAVAAVAAPKADAQPSAAEELAQILKQVDFGSYHALVIGNTGYKHIEKLVSPKADANAISKLLRDEFGFKVTTIMDATRSDIISAFAKMRASLKERDNLLVYYAGHGIVDDATQRGYWLPIDAERDVPTNWVSTADITDMVRAMSAKHVMIVADACYSGTLMRTASARVLTAREKVPWLKRMSEKRARVVMSSGGMEPVMDSGGGEHSVFAKAFITALKENTGAFDALTLFETLRRPVVLNSDQTPQFADIRNAGHDGGEFIFVRRPAAN
ncbi:MAG: SEL1-like repeat protein [Rhodospirillales bacterium]|nr:SEL1-like repeat protein [Rhodospirillales bacterium]